MTAPSTTDRRATRRPDSPGRRSADLFHGPFADRVRAATNDIGRGTRVEPAKPVATRRDAA